MHFYFVRIELVDELVFEVKISPYIYNYRFGPSSQITQNLSLKNDLLSWPIMQCVLHNVYLCCAYCTLPFFSIVLYSFIVILRCIFSKHLCIAFLCCARYYTRSQWSQSVLASSTSLRSILTPYHCMLVLSN